MSCTVRCTLGVSKYVRARRAGYRVMVQLECTYTKLTQSMHFTRALTVYQCACVNTHVYTSVHMHYTPHHCVLARRGRASLR
jgi:hypothetical protein